MRPVRIPCIFVFLMIIPYIAFAAAIKEAEIDCFIEPYLVVNVGTEVSGVLHSLTVDRGDSVTKGQVLGRLDTRVEEATVDLIRARAEQNAAVEMKKSRLAFADREYKRRHEMYEQKIIPFYDMDEAETNLRIAESELALAESEKRIAGLELKQAEQVVNRRVITSPINGVVVERYLSPGELVNEKPILQLAQIDPLNVEVIMPISAFGKHMEGDRVEVVPESPVGGTYKGRIKIVDQVIDAASGTFGLRIELPNKNHSIPAGLKCQVRFLKK